MKNLKEILNKRYLTYQHINWIEKNILSNIISEQFEYNNFVNNYKNEKQNSSGLKEIASLDIYSLINSYQENPDSTEGKQALKKIIFGMENYLYACVLKLVNQHLIKKEDFQETLKQSTNYLIELIQTFNINKDKNIWSYIKNNLYKYISGQKKIKSQIEKLNVQNQKNETSQQNIINIKSNDNDIDKNDEYNSIQFLKDQNSSGRLKKQLVLQFINNLPKESHYIMVLYFEKNKSIEEIASIMNKSQITVKKTINITINNLNEFLKTYL